MNRLRHKLRQIAPRQAVLATAFAAVLCGAPARAEPPTFVESADAPRIYLGDEDARLGRVHLLRGHFGLAERHFRRAVEVTPQNGSAWNGLGAAYDGLGRFDLSARAYRNAQRLSGANAATLNNLGFSHMLRGHDRTAARYFERAQSMAPDDPTIANNRSVLELGQTYFWVDTFWRPAN